VGPGNVEYSPEQRLWTLNDKTHKMTQSMVTVEGRQGGGLQAGRHLPGALHTTC
jgi:hypothetical protein